MITMDEIMRLSDAERMDKQKGFLRELAIGAWAPYEPRIMKMLLNTLGPRKLFSQKTTLKIVDRLISRQHREIQHKDVKDGILTFGINDNLRPAQPSGKAF